MANKIAIICYQYSIEVAPVLKNICSYCYEKGLGMVDVIVEDLHRDKTFRLPSARIVNMREELQKNGFDTKIIKQLEKQIFEQFLKDHITQYSLIFAVDFLALDILRNAGQNLSNVVYLSMEGIDYILRYDKTYAKDLISGCAFCVTQSKKRGDILKKFLGMEIDFEYLPIALRPVEIVKGDLPTGSLNMLYSGYFAEWACILEFLNSFKSSRSFEISNFVLHGHSMGTDAYLAQVTKLVQSTPNTRIDTDFYDEARYMKFMRGFDVGILFYRDLTGTENFSDLSTASGKLAYYLWNGLGVLTNIQCEETKTLPFIYIDNFSEDQVRQGLTMIKEHRILFRNAAYNSASSNYNFDIYMDRIAKRMSDILNKSVPHHSSINSEQAPINDLSIRERVMAPRVSIFIPVYNGEKYLSETIQSILSQTFQDFEIIIADDGSSDSTLKIAGEYEKRDRRIRILSLPHGGEVAARNEAIKCTNPSSKYLLNHDSDDISLPNKLERLIEYLDTHSEIAIVGCFAEYFDDSGNSKGNPHVEWKPEMIRETFGQVNSIINSAALIRRRVFDSIGNYREEYRSVDDYDFFARALLAGFQLANIPEVLHKIRLHTESIGSTKADLQERLAKKIKHNYVQHLNKSAGPAVTKHSGERSSKSQSLSILHTVEFYHPHIGGSEIVVQQLSERLAKRGHHVEVATTRLPERNFHELNGVAIREFEIAGNIPMGFTGKDVQLYQEFLLSHQANVVMNYAAQQWATDLAFLSLEATRDKRVNIITPCGYSALENAQTLRWPQFSDYFNKIIPMAIPLYDAAVYHSALYKDYEFAHLYGFSNSVVIPNGVDEEEFSRYTAIDFRNKYGITAPYIGLCVANFYGGKGHDRVIEAVRQMARKDFIMIFIGKEGEQLELLKSKAERLNIRFLINVPREDTVAAFRAADIFLFGSYIEASPLVIIEAKASKTPFVSTDCGNVKEWKGGIICKPEEMAENANKILDDESLRKRLAEEGYREWKEKLTWEAVVDKYEDLYVRLHHAKITEKNKTLSMSSFETNDRVILPHPPTAKGGEDRLSNKNEESQLIEKLQKNFRDVQTLIRLAEIEQQRSDRKKARNYLIAALAIDPQNPTAKTLMDKLH